MHEASARGRASVSNGNLCVGNSIGFGIASDLSDEEIFDDLPGLIAALNDLSTTQVNTEVDNALNTAIPGSPTANSVNQRMVAVDDLTQAAGGGDLAAILGDTNELQSDDVPGLIAALNDLSAAQVNTEVDSALDTAIAELSQGVPATTPTVRTALMLMYMALRNKLDVPTVATDTLEIHNDAGTRITQKLLTDDGTDYSEAKMISGA